MLQNEINRIHKTAKYISLAIPFLWAIVDQWLAPGDVFSDPLYVFHVVTVYIYCYVFYRSLLFLWVYENVLKKSLVDGLLECVKILLPFVLLFILAGVAAFVVSMLLFPTNLAGYNASYELLAGVLRLGVLFFWNMEYDKAVLRVPL